MASSSNDTQLVLLDGSSYSQDLSTAFQNLSNRFRNFKCIVYYNESNSINKAKLENLKRISNVEVRLCKNPSVELLAAIPRKVKDYLYVHVICNSRDIDYRTLNEITDKHSNVSLIQMNTTCIDVDAVIRRLEGYYQAYGSVGKTKVPSLFQYYQCPLCSKSFKSNDELKSHDIECHHPQESFDNIDSEDQSDDEIYILD